MHAYLGGRVLVDWADTAVAEPLVRPLVARLTGRDPGPLFHLCPFCGGVDHGRPYVDAAVDVSVAHATGLTIVAISDAGRVGVDVDAHGDAAWVRREAVGKALGVGITDDHLPDPHWHATVAVPGHLAAVVLLSEPAEAEAAPGAASSRRAE